MQTWLYTLASVSLVSIFSLIGVFTLSLNPLRLKRMVLFLVSFAVGGLFGDALIHLLPEAFAETGFGLGTSMLIMSGVLIFFVLEKFLRWRHCHIPTSTEHIHPVATLNFIGDGVHNFLDGLIIGGSFLVSIPIGLTTTLAVILHEIPQEIGDFGILIHKGLSVKKALMFNFLSALTAFAGAFIALLIGPYIAGFTKILVPITAGGFLYIAGSDLIPELHHGGDDRAATAFWQFIMIVLGVAVMATLTFLE